MTLKTFSQISKINTNSDMYITSFEMCDKEYLLYYAGCEKRDSEVSIIIKNEKEFDVPHIMLREINGLLNDVENTYRKICLYENDSVIMSLMSFEEKVFDVISRLIDLTSMSKLSREHEFQKEFLFYWNSVAEDVYVNLFLEGNNNFQYLNTYKNNYDIRIVSHDVKLNDANKTDSKTKEKLWTFIPEMSGYYIPIADNRQILPPTKNNPWNEKEILEILKGRQFSRINASTYQKVCKLKVKGSIIMVFGMNVFDNLINFTVKVDFESKSKDLLISKLNSNVSSVKLLKTNRVDLHYLNHQIGNDNSNLNRKILIIGCGSLGSYVAKELSKSGYRFLTIYDGDKFEYQNLLRSDSIGIGVGSKKVSNIKFELEFLHPQIIVNAIDSNIDESKLIEEYKEHDLIIFTIGSSDEQLKFNKTLKEINCKIPVLFAWLEAGGEYSHILNVDYTQRGCYECLFTDDEGMLINNKVNKTSEDVVAANTIRNGCGGTRAAYGTSVILRTTSVLLDVLNMIHKETISGSNLYDISKSNVNSVEDSFISERCSCCGY